MDKVSLELLTKSGLTEKQAKVYLALLSVGVSTVAQIAEAAELKRPICYVVLDELKSKGYVSEIFSQKGGKNFSAIDPNAMYSQLEQVTRDFKEMLPFLRAQQRKVGKPYVTYYDGPEGAKTAFAQIRKPKNARYALSSDEISKIIPEEVERWKKLYKSGKAAKDGRHLLTDTKTDRSYASVLQEAGQKVRFLLPGEGFGIDLALVDNMVFLTSFDSDVHVTVIESESVFRSMCILYDLAWSGSREFDSKTILKES